MKTIDVLDLTADGFTDLANAANYVRHVESQLRAWNELLGDTRMLGWLIDNFTSDDQAHALYQLLVVKMASRPQR